MKVVIAGGSGFIGTHLTDRLVRDGHQVVVLTRGASREVGQGVRFVSWDASTASPGWISELSQAQGIVNLAGTSLGGGRWTKKRMAEILSSRLAATAAIVEAIGRTPSSQRPDALVNASGIDYYGDRGDEEITEESSAGSSFLAHVCEQWEQAAERAAASGTRVVRVRTSLVFGRGAPAFRLLTLPFRLFAGGPLGNGRQWFTWIHVDDLVGLYLLALQSNAVSGPINAVAPDVRRQREVAREIGRVLHRPSSLPTPAALLRVALGRQADLLLDGRRAVPARANALGYRFSLGQLPDALRATLH